MNSNNLEKQKEIILNLFKKKQYDDVIIQGEILLKEIGDTQRILSKECG